MMSASSLLHDDDVGGQNRTGKDSTGEDRTGQDRTGQGRTDMTGHDRAEQSTTGQDKSQQNVWVFIHSGEKPIKTFSFGGKIGSNRLPHRRLGGRPGAWKI